MQVKLLHPELPHFRAGPASTSTAAALPHIVADPDRVRGILLNLYTNAAKFTKRGGLQGMHELSKVCFVTGAVDCVCMCRLCA